MTKKKGLGEWAFVLGVLLAVVAGLMSSLFASATGTVGLALVVLGLIVGLLNIDKKETVNFLVAAIALMLTVLAQVENLPLVGQYLDSILGNIVMFVAPAVLVVALKTIFSMGKD